MAATWIRHDTRGTLDGGTACDECGACDCPTVAECAKEYDCKPCKAVLKARPVAGKDKACGASGACGTQGTRECIGLSLAWVLLDGGDTLCDPCAAEAGVPEGAVADDADATPGSR